MLSAKSLRETPKTSANTAYARPLPAVTAPQAWTVPGLRLTGRVERRLAGKLPGTATGTVTAMANLLTVMAIHAAGRARRPTGVTAPAARAVPVACLARGTAVRVAWVVRTANLLTMTTIRAASGGGQRLRRRRRRRRPTRKVAGGLVGGHRCRWMLSALGAPMHCARSAKPLCVIPGLRSLTPCIW